MRTIKKGATGQSVYFDVLDSTSTTGGRKTGLAYNTSSLVAYYVRSQGTATAITLATLAAANTAWSSGGFKEVDATNMPGIYRLDVPDAAFAAGAGDDVVVVIKGATGMVQASCDVQLVAWDPQDAVRGGLTALPNAAAEAAGGLYTRGTGAGQINQDANGRVDVNGKAWAGGAIPAPNVTGVPLVDDKYLLGTIYSTPATAGIQDINVINWKGSAAAAMTGDAYARLGAPAGASVSADVAAVKAVLPAALVSGRIDASVGAMAANVLTSTAIAADAITDAKVASDVTIASVTGAVGSVTGNVGGNVTGSVGSVVGAVGSVTGLTASNLDATVSSRMAASSYTAPLAAAGVRAAVGLASANLDTQFDALPTNAELATALAGADDATLAALATLSSGISGSFTALQSHGDGAWATATGFATASDATAIKSTTDKLDDTLEDDGGTYRFTANALEQAPTGGAAPTAAAIADEVQTRTIAAVTLVNGLAANSMTAAALATDAVAEIQSGLATTSALSIVSGKIDAIDSKTANLPSDPADQSLIIAATNAIMTAVGDVPTNAELATALGTSDDATLAAIAALPAPDNAGIAAIQAKTDSLGFSVAGKVDANISHVHGVEVIGTGVAGDEWSPAP